MVVLSGILRSLKTFRSSFRIPDKTKLHWYPGHMDRGMKVMQQKLKDVDCIIEVHDARIPFSGRNPNFQDRLTGLRPHILVLNKVDLTDEHLLGQTVDALKSQSISEIIYTNCRDDRCKGVIELHKTIERVVCSSNRYNRNENRDLNVMIIGVPNVGKSSVINSLRNRFLKKAKAASVGGIAGITRAVGSKIKVCENPLIYVYDTPGILTPYVSNIEVGMKLALCSTFKDREVGLVNIADYLLYWLNKHKHFSYTSYLNLKEPTDNIIEALTVAAVSYNMVSKVKEFGGSGGYTFKPDFDAAAYNFISAFRKGTLGLFNLDSDFFEFKHKN